MIYHNIIYDTAIPIFCTGTASDRPARSDPVLFGLQFAADRGVERSSRNPMTTLICKQEIHKYTNTNTIAKTDFSWPQVLCSSQCCLEI